MMMPRPADHLAALQPQPEAGAATGIKQLDSVSWAGPEAPDPGDAARLLGARGGRARAESLSPRARAAGARTAAQARWAGRKGGR